MPVHLPIRCRACNDVLSVPHYVLDESGVPRPDPAWLRIHELFRHTA